MSAIILIMTGSPSKSLSANKSVTLRKSGKVYFVGRINDRVMRRMFEVRASRREFDVFVGLL